MVWALPTRCAVLCAELLKKLSVAMKKQKDARLELDKQKQKDTTFVLKKKDYELLKKELAAVNEAIGRLQGSAAGEEERADSDRLAFPPAVQQDLVRNSPRRSAPTTPIGRYPPGEHTVGGLPGERPVCGGWGGWLGPKKYSRTPILRLSQDREKVT